MSVSAFLVGHAASRQRAFPPEIRLQLEQRTKILGEFSAEDCTPARANLAEAEVIFGTWGMPKLDEPFLEAAPNLKAVFYAAGSIKGFVCPATYGRGIRISSAWRANAIPVTEFTLAAILFGLKSVLPIARACRSAKQFVHDFPVAGVYHSRVGLVSLGAIGRGVAEKLKSFDVRVFAFDPFCEPGIAANLGIQLIPLDEIFSTCDVVSIHTPLLPETEGMIGAKLLSSMKPGATLVNTSRGAVINEPGLIDVLSRRTDLTAFLDVTHPEPPLSDSPLFQLDNVILTPHIAGSYGPEIARMGQWMVDEFVGWLEGRTLEHEVTRGMLDSMA